MSIQDGPSLRLGRRQALRLVAMSACGTAAVGCVSAAGGGGTRAGAPATLRAIPDKNEWPQAFWRSPAEVQEAYRYALPNREVLQYMPCFCGCGSGGHHSNWDCYVREARADGSYILDPMSFG